MKRRLVLLAAVVGLVGAGAGIASADTSALIPQGGTGNQVCVIYAPNPQDHQHVQYLCVNF